MNLKEHLPSKKIQILIVSLLSLGLLYGLVSIFFSPKHKLKGSKFIDIEYIKGEERTNSLLLDSDNDGLYDWQEVAWGLDPHDPYSNGSGILDGKYVEQKQRNELPRYGQIIPESTLTQSEKLGRGLMTALMSIGSSGGILDEQTEAKIVQNVEQEISSMNLGQKLYIRDDFTKIASTEKNTKNYRTQMTELFKRHPIALSDIQTLVSGSQNPQEYQAAITLAARKYENYLQTLESISVPDLVLARHTQLANSVSQLHGAFNNLLKDDMDDMVIFSFFVQLENIMDRAVAAVYALNTFFELIDEPGIFEGISEYEEELEEVEGI